MEPLQPPTGRNARLALVAVGLLTLLAVVAFASRSGLGSQSKATPTPGYVNYAFTAFLIVFVLADPRRGLRLPDAGARGRGRAQRSFKSRVIQNVLTMAFFRCVAVRASST